MKVFLKGVLYFLLAATILGNLAGMILRSMDDGLQNITISVEANKADSASESGYLRFGQLGVEDGDTMSTWKDSKGQVLMCIKLDTALIYINLHDGRPIARKPYRAEMHNHTIWIFKAGKHIGSWGFYKKPFEFDKLNVM